MKKAVLMAMALGLGFSTASAAKLTIWSDLKGPEMEWFTAQTKAFEKTKAANGDTFDIVFVDLGESRDKFIQSAPKGEGPDLIETIPHDQLGQFAVAGVIEPMNSYINSKNKLELAESAIDAFSYNGKLFGVPMWGEAVAVVYNKKLLPGGVPTTWDDFIKTSQGLTNAGKQEFGFLAPIGIQYHMHGLFYSMGAYVFGKNKDGSLNKNDIGLSNDGSVKAVKLINDLRYKYNLIPEGAEDDNVEKDLFLKGKLAMWLTGPWAMGDIKKAGIDYGIGLLPKPTGAKRAWAPFIGVRGMVMNAYSKNKATAAGLANFLAEPNQQIGMNKVGGKVPISRTAVKKLASDPTVVGFGAAIAAGIPMPNIPEMGQVWGPWGDALNLAIKSATPDFGKLMADAVAKIKAAIK